MIRLPPKKQLPQCRDGPSDNSFAGLVLDVNQTPGQEPFISSIVCLLPRKKAVQGGEPSTFHSPGPIVIKISGPGAESGGSWPERQRLAMEGRSQLFGQSYQDWSVNHPPGIRMGESPPSAEGRGNGGVRLPENPNLYESRTVSFSRQPLRG